MAILNPQLSTFFLDTSFPSILEIRADYIAPLTDFRIYMLGQYQSIQNIIETSFFIEFDAGLPLGTLVLDLYQNTTFISSFSLEIFSKFTKNS